MFFQRVGESRQCYNRLARGRDAKKSFHQRDGKASLPRIWLRQCRDHAVHTAAKSRADSWARSGHMKLFLKKQTTTTKTQKHLNPKHASKQPQETDTGQEWDSVQAV